jgi:tetratricopeptide (TPR) repeat protein
LFRDFVIPCVAFDTIAVAQMKALLLAGAVLGLMVDTVAQQPHAAHRIPMVPDELLMRPVPLRTGIGTAHDTVTTASPQAQAFYDQGLAYLHSYVWIEAARSFNQALRIDPALAMAQVGLSYALVELNAPANARAALDRARALAPGASEHDRLHIDARALQMKAEASRESAALSAYRNALDAALAKHPSDAELWLLRGVAQSPDPADRGQGSVAASIPFFDRAMATSPNHFAAHHYLTHASENTGRAADALAHGAAFAKLAPAIPHAQHMHGHVLRRLGRIGDAVAAFEAAERMEADYLGREQIAPEYDWHYEHNVDLLAASYRYLGRMKDAERLLKTAFDVPSALVVQMFNKRAWPELLIARGRTDQALQAARVLAGHPSPVVSAAGHVTAGRALVAAGQFKAAADEANAALKQLRAASDGAALVAPALETLQGEFFLRTGPKEKGRAMLDEIIRRLREASGPDTWAQTLFTIEAIARAARDAGDWEFAGFAARQLLAQDPDYAAGHYALALVAEHNGDSRTAQAEFALARKYWAEADPDLLGMIRR